MLRVFVFAALRDLKESVAGAAGDGEWKRPSPESVSVRIKAVLDTLSPQAQQHPKLSELLRLDVAEICRPPPAAASAAAPDAKKDEKEQEQEDEATV